MLSCNPLLQPEKGMHTLHRRESQQRCLTDRIRCSPSLSGSPVFGIDAVEVWRVEAPLEDEEVEAARGGRSILDKTKEDQEFLGLAGRQVHLSAERE